MPSSNDLLPLYDNLLFWIDFLLFFYRFFQFLNPPTQSHAISFCKNLLLSLETEYTRKESETEILQTTTTKGVPSDVEGEAQRFVCAGGSVVSVGDRAGGRGGRHRYTGMTDSIITALRLPIPCV